LRKKLTPQGRKFFSMIWKFSKMRKSKNIVDTSGHPYMCSFIALCKIHLRNGIQEKENIKFFKVKK
jgi:hypothetical protein